MKSISILLSLVFACSLAFTSCAQMNSSNTEPLLSAAGFRVKKPENESQQQIFTQLPAYKLQRGTHEGRVFYAYKDETDGIAYIGGEAEYEKYQQLATQRQIANDQLAAAQMNQSMAQGWHSAWGPHYAYYY